MALSGCASDTVKQRPGVLEAKSCLKHIGKSVDGYDDYTIRSCTNNGVWVVEGTDQQTGNIERYDFVNKEYTGDLTAETPTSLDALEQGHKEAFLTLQKNLNKALLR